jgi:hypothetical protein
MNAPPSAIKCDHRIHRATTANATKFSALSRICHHA